jgi:hypothetical protein
LTLSIQDAAIKVWDFPNIQALGDYILKVSSDRNLFHKHTAWRESRLQDLSPQFLKYWNESSASGDSTYIYSLHTRFALIAIISHVLSDVKPASWLMTFTSRAALCLWKNANGVGSIYTFSSFLVCIGLIFVFAGLLCPPYLWTGFFPYLFTLYSHTPINRMSHTNQSGYHFALRFFCSSCISLEDLFSTNWSTMNMQPALTP